MRPKKQPESPAIRDAELEVMRVLWETPPPVPLAHIRAVLAQRCGWEDSTTKTLLRRLQSKNAVRLESRGMYAPILTRQEFDRQSARTLVDRLFDGSAKKLVVALVSDGALSRQDVAELTALFHEGDADHA